MDAATSFWATPVGWTLATLGGILLVVVGILISLAFLLLADRKIWAGVQLRKGPNVVGPFGLLQSFADFFKFVLKEIVIPAGSDKVVFILAPLISFVLAFIAWAVIPFAPGWVVSDLNVGILYILAISSLGVYGIIMGGWASNSKYPFLGSLRSAAQMVSYEVSMGLIIINVILLAGTMNLTEIVTQQQGWIWNWNAFGGGLETLPTIIVMLPMTIVFFISALAETNRPPFDLPEAESELVAGYQVEYSSTPYLLFMIGEYANIVFMCAMITLLFCGGWNPGFPTDFLNSVPAFVANLFYLAVFAVKVVFWFFMIALVKAFVPRYRYDQLMRLGWKIFLPASLVAVVFVAAWRVFAVGG
ncbi:NADH-quinone oxidoreductase subunit NuoH [Brevundimonas diminuta]|jgi:NADH-quinone oxidoreductase subunit H|uniref:NADH-quinone oxidoreductase subunit H n=1 Tax=Brevundimonas diminuta TaxID=293 RepID=A0A2X1ARB2_BREDI|nr:MULTISPECIES: NADH-quinone oxidoreductase subunit NuoH [Brevundimonas]EKY30026.1 NADH-quinone oxidoreductase subunit H [Brevundimonas diminuta 470-4]OJU54672.1 MAG: NADH-quinone oxidoreductase subunit H [Brevundimonas sp. 67-6]MBD3572175.1 NADH-quinone oxidoreductase subunit NuoH [Brevundimonas diminuta]MCO8019079.1 NADH-quinone oxidoreductase subunit NuoH [Brevundimonas diminuta]MCO8021756.1 NADH-quinone oxidoreductase subunit NuoH [Brevundimonas diminuta]